MRYRSRYYETIPRTREQVRADLAARAAGRPEPYSLVATADQVAAIAERDARIAKAHALADVLLEHLRAAGITTPVLARQAARGLGADARAQVAALAGRPAPSAHTWAIVLNIIDDRLQDQAQ